MSGVLNHIDRELDVPGWKRTVTGTTRPSGYQRSAETHSVTLKAGSVCHRVGGNRALETHSQLKETGIPHRQAPYESCLSDGISRFGRC